jgi:hypothetical protein
MHAAKERLRVEIFTGNQRILADIFIFPGARLTDIMTAREAQSFIALTNVEAYDVNDGKELFRTDFANINKNHIVLIHPVEVPDKRMETPSF